MPRPRTSGLTDYELAIMNIFWDKAPLSVSEVLENLDRKPLPAYTSLLTIMRAMEKKGYISREKIGKAHLYRPKLKKASYQRAQLRKMVKNVFNDSSMELATNLIKQESLTKAEIADLKNLLEQL